MQFQEGLLISIVEVAFSFSGYEITGIKYLTVEIAFIMFISWMKGLQCQQKLSHLKGLISYTVLSTLNILEDFSSVIQSITQLPQNITPEHQVFIRGNHLGVFHDLHKYLDDHAWIKV